MTPQKDNPVDSGVPAPLAAYPEPVREQLLRLRQLILDTAAATEGVGRIKETRKWGQLSYLTPETGSGSTVRLDAVKGEADRVALYFHCQTDLVETFTRLYPDTFCDVEGNRALRFATNEPLPDAPLRHCIALALTYHARKKRPRR